MIDHRTASDGALVTTVVAFLLDGQRYGVHVNTVERVVHMVAVSPLPGAPGITIGAINVHGAVVPVLDLRRRFGLPPLDYGVTGHLLIVRTPTRSVAFPVDAVVEVTEVDPETVRPAAILLPGVGYVSGIAATPDGLLFIHDVDTFLSAAEEVQLAAAVTEVQA